MNRLDAPRRSIPSLRAWMRKAHLDLLTIHASVNPYAGYTNSRLSLVERMVLTLEDRRFFSHGGFELRSIFREFVKFFWNGSNGGASTIDMQFVRTTTGYRERTLRRKMYEMFLATVIQFRYPKIVILRSYLSKAYFGHGLRGIMVASMVSFGKAPEDLTLAESSELASYLVFPRPSNAVSNPIWCRKVLRRSNYIQAVYIRREKRFDKVERRIFS